MEACGGIVVVGYLVWCVLKDIRDQLIAARLKDDPTFINAGWIRYRRIIGGSIETLGTDGFKRYASEAEFRKKTGRSLC